MDDDTTGAEAEDEEYAEEAEEEGGWEERGRKIEKGSNTGRRKKDAPPSPTPWSCRKRRRCLIRIWVISSSSWDHPPCIRSCTFPPVPVMAKMFKRMERGYRDTAATMTAVI